MTDLDHRQEVATRVALAAGRLAREFFERRHELAVERKGMQDLVSVADKSVEELIRRELGAAFPEDAFLGEEGGGGEAPHLWIIDPIDGTANFLRGLPYWCCVIAYVVDGVTELAFTMDPVHDELFVARRGQGAIRNGTPIRISGRDDARESCVGLSFNFKLPGERYVSLVDGLVGAGFDHRRMGSSALALCHVADSRLDGAVIPLCSSWDVIAGLLTVESAGGLATRWTDGCSLTGSRAVAAATPGIAPALERVAGVSLRAG